MPRSRPPLDRLMEKIMVDQNGCWLWQAAIDRYGYGQFRHRGQMRGAHAVSFELANGPVPDGHQARKAKVPS